MADQNYNSQQDTVPVNQPVPAAKPRRPIPWPWIGLGIVVLVIVLGIFGILMYAKDNDADDYDFVSSSEPTIARVFVEGTISSQNMDGYDHQFLLNTIDGLIYDDNNMALIIYLDTPGGEVLASDELAQKILEYKELTGRPVYAYGHNTMASGGYWVACAADNIFANKFCVTGSIGVTYGTMIDVSGFLERYGIKINTIDSGAQKSMGSPLEEMSAETRAIFQGMIDEYYGYFLDFVCAGRGMQREYAQTIADGRVYTATQAMDLGLIDQVGTYDDLYDNLCEELGVYYVEDYRPPEQFSLLDELSYLLGNSSSNEAETVLQLLPPTGPLAYYQGY